MHVFSGSRQSGRCLCVAPGISEASVAGMPHRTPPSPLPPLHCIKGHTCETHASTELTPGHVPGCTLPHGATAAQHGAQMLGAGQLATPSRTASARSSVGCGQSPAAAPDAMLLRKKRRF